MSTIKGPIKMGDTVYFMGYDGATNPKVKKEPPRPKYATVEIERKKVGFLVTAAKDAIMVRDDDYEGACSTYPEASRLAAKLMKEMV